MFMFGFGGDGFGGGEALSGNLDSVGAKLWFIVGILFIVIGIGCAAVALLSGTAQAATWFGVTAFGALLSGIVNITCVVLYGT